MMSLRMPKDLTAAVEKWAARQPDNPLRSEAIRRLVELGLTASPSPRVPAGKTRTRTRAAELAAETIDNHTDQSATAEEQASRKRRLLKGPKEFRELRRDHPTAGTGRKAKAPK